MRELIRGYAAATLEAVSPADRARVASELGELSGALVRFDDLRQALTDGSVAPAMRRAVLADLLGEHAAVETLALAGFTAYYERASEFGPTTTALTLLAERLPADVLLEPAAGRSAARERLRGYAERIFQELAGREEIDRVEDELFELSRLLDTHDELRHVLADANLAYAARLGVLTDLLDGRAAPATLRLASYVLRAGRTRDIVGTFEWLVELAARERGRRVAEVRSAVPLDEAETERLATALGRLVSRTVEVRVILDPSVVGGILVSVGDLVIDGTVRLRFERLRDLLVQPS